MTPETVIHYKGYRSRPFSREERKTVTILYGGLTWKHERLIQGVFHNLYYNAEPLPQVSRLDMETGKELIDVGACCPTTFVTGNLVNFLKANGKIRSPDEIVNRYVYLTAGACGACRFGQYHQSFTMALDALGLKDFRIFLMAQDGMDQGAVEGGGLEITMPFTLGLVWAVICADLLTDLEYMTRPYEVIPGQTDQVLRESIGTLYEVLQQRPTRGKKWGALLWHCLTDYFTEALRGVKKQWDAIEVDRLQVKPKVKITGEFWLQTHEGDGNYNIKHWLEQEGAEVMVPSIAVWLDYWMRFYVQELDGKRGVDPYALLKAQAIRALQWVFRSTHNRLRKALGYLPPELLNQYELQALAAPFYHNRLSGGEGDMLVGKALHAYHHKTAHMICELTPYSCMPNTMSVGAMSHVLGRYPDLLYAPIEVKGDAEVHALSRCQMILTEAKKRAQQEFDTALNKTGMTIDQIRKYEAQHPEVLKTTYPIRQMGASGTATNYVMALAQNV